MQAPKPRKPFTGWPAAGGNCPTDVYPSQFQSGPLAGGCWVEATETKGPNVDACLDADGNNVCDGRATDTQAHFDFDFTDDFVQANNPVTDRNAAITNAFYWANTLHDWLYRLGFDEPSGNFQADNYNRGGTAGDALWVDVQDAGAQNNVVLSRHHRMGSHRAWTSVCLPGCDTIPPLTPMSSFTNTSTG